MQRRWNSCKSRWLSSFTLLSRHSSLTDTRRRTKQVEDDAPEIADLYFSYGKALLENAIVQNSVLGKEQPENEENKGKPFFVFAAATNSLYSIQLQRIE